MEMLVVVAIIVALAGIGGFFLMGTLMSSQDDVALLRAKKLAEACEQYFLRYKTTPQRLTDLYQTSPPILKDAGAHLDPWGQEYVIDTSQQFGPGIVVLTKSPNTGKVIASSGVGE
jgi:type II secretory pathway pseudopilin PulG